MTKVLYIEVSPRKERSHSIAVAEAFMDAYTTANPDHEVDKMDLWDTELPELNMAMIDAKYRLLAGEELDEREANAWKIVRATFNRVNSADKIVISTPMWNFNVPYKLKHLIDIVIQPDLAFAVVDGGYEGLIKGKPAMLIVARGGAYPPGSEFFDIDFQKRYNRLPARLRRVRGCPFPGHRADALGCGRGRGNTSTDDRGRQGCRGFVLAVSHWRPSGTAAGT